MKLLGLLSLWIDPVPRDGPDAMAVDDWLLESAAKGAVLRVYRWTGDWASLGYFGRVAEARASLEGVNWVRRRTGGGVVDHRNDWTYSLVLPPGEPLALLRGGDSYRQIHRVLADVLELEGVRAGLTAGAATGSALCFANPVAHDVVAKSGEKLAGAGQRRCRAGFLHQGSVAGHLPVAASAGRARRLAEGLADCVEEIELSPGTAELHEHRARRYAAADWTNLR